MFLAPGPSAHTCFFWPLEMRVAGLTIPLLAHFFLPEQACVHRPGPQGPLPVPLESPVACLASNWTCSLRRTDSSATSSRVLRLQVYIRVSGLCSVGLQLRTARMLGQALDLPWPQVSILGTLFLLYSNLFLSLSGGTFQER